MIIDLTEAAWLDERHEVSIEELAEVSGLSVDELEDLVACGALVPAQTTWQRKLHLLLTLTKGSMQ